MPYDKIRRPPRCLREESPRAPSFFLSVVPRQHCTCKCGCSCCCCCYWLALASALMLMLMFLAAATGCDRPLAACVVEVLVPWIVGRFWAIDVTVRRPVAIVKAPKGVVECRSSGGFWVLDGRTSVRVSLCSWDRGSIAGRRIESKAQRILIPVQPHFPLEADGVVHACFETGRRQRNTPCVHVARTLIVFMLVLGGFIVKQRLWRSSSCRS